MTSGQLDEERIFHIAKGIPNLDVRAAYLIQICDGDRGLRERVERLLEVHEREQSFLKSNKPLVTQTVAPTPSLERTGNKIGRYTLREQIGEGGMGAVFVAEQERPIRRKVALKLIKPGMDSKAVIARFEAERQALAMMDHPNIARVLDAGTTDTGHPYFAMELVKGVPITEYCDRNRLTIRERLDLFVHVCRAIQHAHQKGIIHRDIKPSNVLVTLHDGKPVPKVIDFGVAKALNTRLSDSTIYTEHMQIVGTILYMSPEQAELSGLDIDTRTDIYSLGVLLFELLTGTTPFQKEELDRAGFDEQRRMIRDQEPPRASVRISSLGDTATAIAQHRKTDSRKLHQAVCGDLDWIIFRALEKDRTRRHETAAALSDEVRNFLDGLPVESRPPTFGYRTAKYCTRHRATITVMTLLAFGVFVATWQSWRATAESARARGVQKELQESIRQLRNEILERAFSLAFAGDLQGVDKAIKRAEQAEASEDVIAAIQGIAFLYAGSPDSATRHLDDAVTRNPKSLVATAAGAWAHMDAGNIEKGNKLFERTQRLAREQSSINNYTKLLLIQSRIFGTRDLVSPIEELDELIEEHSRWGIPYAIRAMLKVQLGYRTLNMGYLEDAIADFELANKFLPENAFVLHTGIDAHNYAIQLAIHNDLDKTKIEMRGNRICENIEPLKRHLGLRSGRALFYKLTGQDELFASERVALLEAGFCSPQPELAKLLLAGDGRAIQSLTSRQSSITPRIALAIHHAIEGEIGKALAIHGDLEQESISTNTRLLMLDILCVARKPVELTQAAKRILTRLENDNAPSLWWLELPQFRFMAGDITEEELLEIAGPFDLEHTCVAWCIGMKHVAHGRDAEAKKWLQTASDGGGTGWWSTEFSRVYLQLLLHDSTGQEVDANVLRPNQQDNRT